MKPRPLIRSDLRVAKDARRFECCHRARRALHRGVEPGLVAEIFELSRSDVKRLVGQVRA